MGNPGLVVALFDLDGTLCNARHLAASVVSYQFRKPARIPRTVIYIMTQVTRLILVKAGFLTYARTVQASAPEFARLLKGIHNSEAFSLFSKSAQKVVDTARRDMLAVLKWHQEMGHTVILVSGGFQPYLQEVAKLLGINHSVGTALEEVGDYYIGRLAGPFCHEDDRVHLVQNFIEASGFHADLSLSYA